MDFNVTDQILVNLFAIKPLRMNGKQMYICFKKSCDLARKVVSYNIFIDVHIIIEVLVLIKRVYTKPTLKYEMANV
jgi:hypothetical protein